MTHTPTPIVRSTVDAGRLAQCERERDALLARVAELEAALRDMVRYDDLPEAEQQPAVERARAALKVKP